MQTNKLGIPILYNNNTMPYIEGHSIVKHKFTFINIILYYRLSTSTKPYINNLYGIHIYKNYENK